MAAVSEGAFRFKARSTLADSQANAVPGDHIAPRLCAKPHISMRPIDASASAAWSAMNFDADMLRARQTQPSGVDSIDA
jgi:hypothetical protein